MNKEQYIPQPQLTPAQRKWAARRYRWNNYRREKFYNRVRNAAK